MSVSFHALKVLSRVPVAEDAALLTLEVPPALRDAFAFEPGQHLSVRAELNGREVRRTYSIVNGTPAGRPHHLQLGIRVQSPEGLAHFLARQLEEGQCIDVMSPTGRFQRSVKGGARVYLALAAGSGITPILSILSAVLEQEPQSQFALIYGNRTGASSMFTEEILALKNRYLGRFTVHFLMSREPQDVALFNGRVDEAKLEELGGIYFDPVALDEVFICGPGTMVSATREALVRMGTVAPIHIERFAGEAAATATRTPNRGTEGAADEARVTVTQDGRRRSFLMRPTDASVLEAAERAGLELPFSCRSGVCSTCRAKVTQGAATMAHNIALEPWELEAGFVLCCQSRPTTASLELSYDEK